MPQGNKDRNGQISAHKWPESSPKVKSLTVLYILYIYIIYAIRNTIYVKSFIVRDLANFGGYAAILLTRNKLTIGNS